MAQARLSRVRVHHGVEKSGVGRGRDVQALGKSRRGFVPGGSGPRQYQGVFLRCYGEQQARVPKMLRCSGIRLPGCPSTAWGGPSRASR
eukprot:3123077-Rhodomonas_salina.3